MTPTVKYYIKLLRRVRPFSYLYYEILKDAIDLYHRRMLTIQEIDTIFSYKPNKNLGKTLYNENIRSNTKGV